MPRAIMPLLAMLLLSACADRPETSPQDGPSTSESPDAPHTSDEPAAGSPTVLPDPTVRYEHIQELLDVPTAPRPHVHELALPADERHVIVYWSAAGHGTHQIFLESEDEPFYNSVPRESETAPDSQGPPIRWGEASAPTNDVTLRIEWTGVITFHVRIEMWATASIPLSSAAFSDGGAIPSKHAACGEEDISPPLAWGPAPDGAAFFALLAEDLDLPGGGTFLHWWVPNIPTSVTAVAEGEKLPYGNPDANYFGPCPPPDEPHRYLFRIYAVDEELPIEGSPHDLLDGRIVSHGFLVGTYRDAGGP